MKQELNYAQHRRIFMYEVQAQMTTQDYQLKFGFLKYTMQYLTLQRPQRAYLLLLLQLAQVETLL